MTESTKPTQPRFRRVQRAERAESQNESEHGARYWRSLRKKVQAGARIPNPRPERRFR